jgi:integrase
MFYKIKGVSKKSGKGSVSVIYRQQDFEILRSTGVVVAPSDFDTKTGKVKSRVEEHPEHNAKIQEVAVALEKAVRDVKAALGVVTKEAVEAALNQQPIKQPVALPELLSVVPAPAKAKQPTLCQCFSEYISLNPEHRGEKTILGYLDTAKRLQEYSKNTLLPDVNLRFIQGFQSWLVNTKGMRNGSVRTHLDRFKTIYTRLADEENLPYTFLKKFKQIEERQDDNVIFLTDEEIAELEALELPLLSQRQLRAQFLFSCEVGLRHSDLYINHSNIKGDFLNVVMRKGKRTVKPPLSTKAKAIINSQYFPFKPRDIRPYNIALRLLFKKLPSFHKVEMFTHFVGNNPVTEMCPKWQAMSSHVGRKTAINKWLSLGVRESVVAKWAGHKNTKMIEKHYQNYEAAYEQEAKKII